MGRLNVKTWLGFVLNMLVVLLGISDLMLNGPTEADSSSSSWPAACS